MTIGKRAYWIAALIAVFALAGAAITFTSRMSLAGDGTPTAQTCGAEDEADDAAEAAEGPDTDAIENECGPQDEADDANEAEGAGDANEAEDADDANENEAANAGKLDDGADLLSPALITLDEAIAAAQGALDGAVGEIDLEDYNGTLVFNVDIGDKDVKVDAATGAVLATDTSD